MKNLRYIIVAIIGCTLLVGGCKSAQKVSVTQNEGVPFTPASIQKPGPPVIIYKTTGEYYELVPINFSEDRQQIASFPAPNDLIREGNFTYPTELADGFLLDNRGITPTVAFLKYTYKEYYQMGRSLTIKELMDAVIDPAPLKEMYRCRIPVDTPDRIELLNEWINQYRLSECEKLK